MGGPINFIDKSEGRTTPHFTKQDDRIYLSNSRKGLLSIRWDGTDEKEHLVLKGIETYGTSDVLEAGHGHNLPDLLPSLDDREPTDKASRPTEIRIAPDGKMALAKINNDIYTVTVPKYGKTPTISVARAESATFPAVKLTKLGGEFPAWSADSKYVHWSLGASHFRYDLAAGAHFRDSLKAAEKAERRTLLKRILLQILMRLKKRMPKRPMKRGRLKLP